MLIFIADQDAMRLRNQRDWQKLEKSLDLISITKEQRIVDSGIVPISISEHSLVYCILKTGVKKAPSVDHMLIIWSYTDVFINDLKHVPWFQCEN